MAKKKVDYGSADVGYKNAPAPMPLIAEYERKFPMEDGHAVYLRPIPVYAAGSDGEIVGFVPTFFMRNRWGNYTNGIVAVEDFERYWFWEHKEFVERGLLTPEAAIQAWETAITASPPTYFDYGPGCRDFIRANQLFRKLVPVVVEAPPPEFDAPPEDYFPPPTS